MKILYDIEQLLVSQGKETGICRVELEILKELSYRKGYQIYPLVTIKNDRAEEYLKAKGLNSLIPNIVYLPYLKKSTKSYNWRQKLKSSLLIKLLRKKYTQEIQKYDKYISIFSPISPIVYQSKIETIAFVHDLIPIKFPDYASVDFSPKYKKWIGNLKADKVICISASTKKDFLAERPDYEKKKIKVVYLAANKDFKPTPKTDIREKYGIKTKKYVLAVSELTERKNFEHLVKAFMTFLNKTKAEDVSLVIVGIKRDGYEALSQLVAKQKAASNKIILPGFVADDDIPALYSEAEIFIYPSLYEGFGLPVLEAMQCGTAVVCCNNSSLPEVGGEAVKYISGRDEAETAEALQILYQSEKLRQTLETQGIARATLFNWQKTVDEILK